MAIITDIFSFLLGFILASTMFYYRNSEMFKLVKIIQDLIKKIPQKKTGDNK